MVKIGMLIADRYEILEKTGTGGMSVVYRAKDHKLNRIVAVKVLKQEFSDNANFVSKFRIEAQAAAGLMHPNIVNVYDVGEEKGIYYIVMEYVDGITLKKYIEKKSRLTVKEAISIAIQVSMGLEAAHNNHVIHRDIKPQNIMISRDGKVKVADFGIAKAATSNTITSNVMGSVHYTSPEQARGGYSDERSDIYSLGITMFEMLTGRVPFNGETTVAIAIKHIQQPMPSPREYVPDIPRSVEQIVMKCCEKSPDRRYQNMGELIADLKQALIHPDDDFVKVINPDEEGATRMAAPLEQSEIRRQSGYTDRLNGGSGYAAGGAGYGTTGSAGYGAQNSGAGYTAQGSGYASSAGAGYAGNAAGYTGGAGTGYSQRADDGTGYNGKEDADAGYTGKDGVQYPLDPVDTSSGGRTAAVRAAGSGSAGYDDDGAEYDSRRRYSDRYGSYQDGYSQDSGYGADDDGSYAGGRSSYRSSDSRGYDDGRYDDGGSYSAGRSSGRRSQESSRDYDRDSRYRSTRSSRSEEAPRRSSRQDDYRYRSSRYDDYDYERKSGKGLTILAVIVAVLIGAAIVIYAANRLGLLSLSEFGIGSSTESTTSGTTGSVTLPTMVGENAETLKTTLNSLGLIPEVTYQESDEYDSDIVMGAALSDGTALNAGDTVEPGTNIVLTVSAGKSGVTVPDVSGKTRAEAAAELRRSGFDSINWLEGASSTVEKGLVVSQDPAGGSTAPANTTVTVTLSTGPDDSEQVQVPDVTGVTLEAATQTLTDNNLTVGSWTEAETDDPNQVGLVISQSVEANTFVDPGTSISLTIGKAAEQKPTTYSYSESIQAPTAEEAPDYVPGTSVYVVFMSASGQTLINQTTSSFPIPTGFTGITSETGTIQMSYPSTAADAVNGQRVITRTVTFTPES